MVVGKREKIDIRYIIKILYSWLCEELVDVGFRTMI